MLVPPFFAALLSFVANGFLTCYLLQNGAECVLAVLLLLLLLSPTEWASGSNRKRNSFEDDDNSTMAVAVCVQQERWLRFADGLVCCTWWMGAVVGFVVCMIESTSHRHLILSYAHDAYAAAVVVVVVVVCIPRQRITHSTTICVCVLCVQFTLKACTSL